MTRGQGQGQGQADGGSGKSLVKVLFAPHGGGPMPILGDDGHKELVRDLKALKKHFHPALKCIVVVTAHWEGEAVKITAQEQPELLFDYYGFPDEAYHFSYAAPGAPLLARKLQQSLKDAGIPAELDTSRGYDHGTFVPLMLLAPEATIPVLQVSLLKSLDPQAHVELGAAIGEFLREVAAEGDGDVEQEGGQDDERDEGDDPRATSRILLVGSGLSFHNLRTLHANPAEVKAKSSAFDAWLNAAILGDSEEGADGEDTLKQLVAWEAEAPHARYSHPREEHFLPLLVCAGAANKLSLAPRRVSSNLLYSWKNSGFLWE